MGGFFRRRRRSKEAEEEPPESPPEKERPPAGKEGAEPSADASSESRVGTEAPATARTGPAPSPGPTADSSAPSAPSAPAGPPPPLPEADRDAAHSSVSRRRPLTKCFLCDTPLDGPWCPKCRMAWVE